MFKLQRGSITVYLSLSLLLMLSLLFALLYSARIAASRAVLQSGAEQSLFSIFGQFDRGLYEQYGLLFFDGGYGSTELDLGSLYEEAMDGISYCLQPDRDRAFFNRDALGISPEEGSITGCTLATDGNGAPFRRQICSAAKETLAISALTGLQAELTDAQGKVDFLEDHYHSWNQNALIGQYQALQLVELSQGGTQGELSSCRMYEPGDTGYPKGPSTEVATEGEASQEALDTQTVLDSIIALQKLGLYNLVVPKDKALSSLPPDEKLPSARMLNEGFGIVPSYEETGAKLLEQAYLVEMFPCYTSENSRAPLHCQVERVIGKRDSDAENLKAVLNRLSLMREASNFYYLETDPEKSQEVEALSVVLATGLGAPEFSDLLAAVIRLCWAYGETLIDLHTLLSGGEVPLLKDDASWQLSFSSLASLAEKIPTEGKTPEKGHDYKWYLNLLLLMESEASLNSGLMDLVELNVRHKDGGANFRLDNCLDAVTFVFRARTGNLWEMKTERSYGYDQ